MIGRIARARFGAAAFVALVTAAGTSADTRGARASRVPQSITFSSYCGFATTHTEPPPSFASARSSVVARLARSRERTPDGAITLTPIAPRLASRRTAERKNSTVDSWNGTYCVRWYASTTIRSKRSVSASEPTTVRPSSPDRTVAAGSSRPAGSRCANAVEGTSGSSSTPSVSAGRPSGATSAITRASVPPA